MSKSEVWKDIPGYEGSYQASSLGQIRSLDRVDRSGKKRKGDPCKKINYSQKYPRVGLSQNRVNETFRVHVLVALTFLGPRPDGMHVCHEDGDRTNNNLENLSYKSASDNEKDKVTHGTSVRGSKCHMSKLSEETVRMIKFGHTSQTGRQIAEIYGVTESAVSLIRSGKSWGWLEKGSCIEK